jgi:hypothetical protein
MGRRSRKGGGGEVKEGNKMKAGWASGERLN